MMTGAVHTNRWAQYMRDMLRVVSLNFSEHRFPLRMPCELFTR